MAKMIKHLLFGATRYGVPIYMVPEVVLEADNTAVFYQKPYEVTLKLICRERPDSMPGYERFIGTARVQYSAGQSMTDAVTFHSFDEPIALATRVVRTASERDANRAKYLSRLFHYDASKKMHCMGLVRHEVYRDANGNYHIRWTKSNMLIEIDVSYRCSHLVNTDGSTIVYGRVWVHDQTAKGDPKLDLGHMCVRVFCREFM